jgi:hypothetical protein
VTELVEQVKRLMSGVADRDLAAELIVDAVKRGLGRMGGRPRKPVTEKAEPVTPQTEPVSTCAKPVTEISKPVSGQKIAQRAEKISGSDPDPDLEKRDPRKEGGAGGEEKTSAAPSSTPAAPTPVSKRAAKRAKLTDAAFGRWYEAFPRKVGVGAAWRTWKRLAAGGELADVEAMIAALEWQKRSREWTKDGGAFVPHPATYLNGHRWLDQPPSAPPSAGPPVRPASPPPMTPPTARGWHLTSP